MMSLRTDRLILRSWRNEDLRAFFLINSDPEVMEFFPRPLNRLESDLFVEASQTHLLRHGFGRFALELRETGEFIGYVGISHSDFEETFTPCVEMGWRLAKQFWKMGFATEAGHALLKYCFAEFTFQEVLSFTSKSNQRSIAVMERLGMSWDPRGTFSHPRYPIACPHREHLLYKISRDAIDRE